MSELKFKGSVVHTVGTLPKVGSDAPDFSLTKLDLSEASLKDFTEKRIVLNIFPSLDTGTCAKSVRKFNQEATTLDDVTVLCVSADLPFAHKRFCEAEGLNNIVSLSTFRNSQFGEAYGTTLKDGPLSGLQSRAVVIIHEGKIQYTQQVSEITDEPNYDEVLAALK